MNTTPTKTAAPDELDRLLSDFFKSQLKQPWPKAPVPSAAASEPSELATARSAEAPRRQPTTTTTRDNTARARFTLAASVALLLGTCWYMSSGFNPGERPAPVPATNGGGMLDDSGAKGGKGDSLEGIHKNKLNDGNAAPVKPDPIKPDLSKLE
jgi:hypothetical protein